MVDQDPAAAAGVTLRYDIDDADPPVHIELVIYEDQPDLTNHFYDGVTSIQVGENAGNWEVFDAVNYNGNTVVLISGEEYANPGEMGIVHPVKSIRKLVDN
ncbi:hypothetical protein ABFA07_023572 [Porites harrisoni]